MMTSINFKNIFQWPLSLKIVFFTLIAAVVFYLLYLWDISDLMNQLSTSEQKEKNSRQQLESTISKEIKLKKETEQFPSVESTLAQWQKKLISYREFPKLINEILKLGASNHLVFKLFTPGKEVKTGNYFKIPIKITAMGDYHDFSHFLSEIANLPEIVVISNFMISKTEADPATKQPVAPTNFLTAEIILEVYYLVKN